MTTAAAPESTNATAPKYSLSSPPPGAYFDVDEVKGDHGQKSYGKRPLLSWHESEEGVNGMIAFYGHVGVARIANGTSIRVTGQSIARRVTEKAVKEGKLTDDEINEKIAADQLEYRPGKRQGGQSTEVSRAAAAAKKAAGKISGDAIASLLEQVANATPAQLESLRALGIDPSKFTAPVADDEEEENGEGTEGENGEQPQG